MLANLQNLGYLAMTPIQAAALPLAMAGHDLVAQAATGSGKTAAFALALLHRLDLERRAIANQSLERELEIAAQIQKCSLPTEAPTASSYDFAWASTPAQRIGGDHIDWLAGSGGEVHAVVADASGHGINSALLMNTFRAHWRAGALSADGGPTALASELNGIVVHDAGATGMFVTAAFLRLACDGSSVRLCSAGHNPTLHWRAAEGRLDVVDADGPPLGFLGAMAYGARDLALAPGDVACVLAEPAMTNIGIVQPDPGFHEALREITRRLTQGLATRMPDLQQRVDHILKQQVFGIGPPAVQEHQPLAGVRRPALQGFANGLISLPGLHRFQRGGATTGFHAAWSQGPAPCWRHESQPVPGATMPSPSAST
jgi:hypothetical protein